MRLLLAEDEKELSRATATLLRMNGYEVDTAYDGEETLEMAQKSVYDGFILDIMMPKMDGITVLKMLREQGELAPILMLTAKATVDDKVTGLTEGANDYMTKPYSIKELAARVQAMLRSGIQMLPEVIRGVDFQIVREGQMLESESSSVSLSFYEFHMLEIFLCHPGCGFSTAQILEKVWGSSKDESVVEIYIAYLNNKLKSVQGHAQILKDDQGVYILEVIQ